MSAANAVTGTGRVWKGECGIGGGGLRLGGEGGGRSGNLQGNRARAGNRGDEWESVGGAGLRVGGGLWNDNESGAEGGGEGGGRNGGEGRDGKRRYEERDGEERQGERNIEIIV